MGVQVPSPAPIFIHIYFGFIDCKGYTSLKGTRFRVAGEPNGFKNRKTRQKRKGQSPSPPAAWYEFSKDREGKHPTDHLNLYKGWIYADGYAGFNNLFAKDDVQEMACMAHVRRKFVDIFQSQ